VSDETSFYTLAQAARRLCKSEGQIRGLILRGELQSMKLYGRIVVRVADVERYALPYSIFESNR
jgi:helix-turn-helix protein